MAQVYAFLANLGIVAVPALLMRRNQVKPLLAVAFGIALFGASEASSAQDAADLVSSWTLVSVERNLADPEPERVRGRGLLVLDGAGNVFEFFSTVGRDEPENPQLDPQRAFASFGGFWGRYAVDEAAGRIAFEAQSGVSPDLRGLRFTRRYELDGEWLTVTSADEPQAQADTRWIWQRVPTVEHLTPAYREVVGFWQHVEERRVNLDTGEVEMTRVRAPSLIVYTPGGMVGVHFPSVGREPFATASPTPEEAQAALRGYLGYFGTLGVYPGEVSHNVLAGVSPGTGAILRRFAAIDGDDLIVTLQGTAPRRADDDRPRTVTTVHLRRLSGADDMLPHAP